MTDHAKELADLEELARLEAENRLALYEAYPKQAEFHRLGALHRERLFLAGNQLGKTWAGAMEAAAHLTGQYPPGWEGRRFPGPTRGWAASDTAANVRDAAQRLLLGRVQEFGTGAIPKSAILDWKMQRGTPDAVDTISVRHVSGGISTLGFKSYEAGREKFQGETLEFVWADEEPPPDVYSEMKARITARRGLIFITATPLLGMSEVVGSFYPHPRTADAAFVQMTIDDAKHIPPDERAKIIAGYPAHERDARARGIPMLGSGRVFPIAEEMLAVDAFPLPSQWLQLLAVDFGWSHPFAAVHLALDADRDTVYVTNAYRQAEATPTIHAATLKGWGAGLHVAWPHDGLQHDKGSGVPLAAAYRRLGLNMLDEHAQFEDGSTGVEAGLIEMLSRMETGRFKVFRHLSDWWAEFRVYHRRDGKLVKLQDDLLSATRYGVISLRFARPPIGSRIRIQTRAETDEHPAEFAIVDTSEHGAGEWGIRPNDPRFFNAIEE